MQSYLAEGKIVPAEITVGLLDTAIQEQPEAKLVLVDGFPRNLENYTTWYEKLPHLPVLGLMLLEVSPTEMRRRMLLRGQGRPDDNEETLSRRLRSYEDETLPVAEQFNVRGQLFKVAGEGSADEVFSRLVGSLRSQRMD
jgi:adenylate kinase family enzyme